MKRFLLILLLAVPVLAQQSITTTNPLIDLRDEVKKVLEDAKAPFSEEQEKAIALMMEDRRQASEDLFGQLMDFRGGPVQGEQQDRAKAAIDWMQAEFRKRLGTFLTTEQAAAWERHEGAKTAAGATSSESAAASPQQTQLIRINNNMFTAEGPCYGCGGERTEVIQRGGIGAFHGSSSFEFKDESLNARNPFAGNRPPYQERRTNASINGPFIRNRLTANLNFNHTLQESADTIHAVTPQGPFDLGISHPFTEKNINGGGTYQISDKHSLIFYSGKGSYLAKNQGIGGFNLPERASTGKGGYWNFGVRQFSVFSPQIIYETRFNSWNNHNDSVPLTNAVQINVLDSFNAGGAQNKNENDRNEFNVSNLFTRMGSKLTVKAGFEANYVRSHSLSENNFLGSFTFSDLTAYRENRPASYSVTRGNPLLDMTQTQWSLFIQNDLKLTQRLTAMFGLRFEDQTNISDHDNFGPRLGFAYAANRTTVVRGGIGVFYQRLWDFIVQNQMRLDGAVQYQIVIDDPSYPDPFLSGTLKALEPPSIRVTDPDLSMPYEVLTSISVEKTFKNNLFLSAKYDQSRGVRSFRARNLNAPLPGQEARLDSTWGNIWNLESTGFYRNHIIGVSVRQRFSIFNVNANYNYYAMFGDSDGPFGSPSNNYHLRADWGRVGMPSHNVNSNVNAKLLWGIFLTQSMNINSGNRYNITTGNDDNNDSVINDRPTGMRRNTGDGPRFINFNYNISKAFFLGKTEQGSNGGSQPNINLFANMTNAYNRTNYGTPSGVMTSSFFRKSYNARNAREVQVGLRFQF